MNWNEMIPELPELDSGAHEETEGKMCAMELVAFMERLPHSDRPPCTCPVLASYVRNLNDPMPNDRRQDLKPVLPFLVGTVNPSLEQARAEHFAMSVATKLVPIAIRPTVGDELADAMASAKGLAQARDAAYAAHAFYAAHASYAAAHAAAHASYAAADAAASAANHDFWQHAIDILVEAIQLDPAHKPAQWEYERVRELA